MRAGTVAARDEGSILVFDGFESGYNVLRALHARGVGLRSNQNEIVVHYRIPSHPLAFGEELLLRGLCMNKHHVSIATPSGVERLACALRDDFYFDPGFSLE